MNSGNKSIVVSKKITLSIKPNNRGADLGNSLYAINWFDTKLGWLYKIYNMLAVGSVLKAGGRPFLKANTIRSISGDHTLNRDIILLVKYPSADSFLRMISKKYFQLISLLRRSAVKGFTFGFANKLSDNKWEKNDEESKYVTHHFQYQKLGLQEILDNLSLDESDTKIFFAGEVNSHIHFKNGNNEQQVPCIMDGLIIYQTKNINQLEEFLLSKEYQSNFSDNVTSSNIVEIKRVL